MNDSSYTILIPVLLILLAATVGMLYTRFASRSRENSEEVDLVDIDLAMSSVSAADAKEDRSEAYVTQRVPFLESRSEIVPVLEVASSDEKSVEETSDGETEYFDGLQEAAAGLAALMRSSPVGKSTPVVYAPDDLEEEFLDAEDAVTPEDEPQEILLPVSRSTSDDSDVVESVDDTVTEGLLEDEPITPIPLEGSEVGFAEVEAVEPDSVATLETELSETTDISNALDSIEVVERSTAVEEVSAISASAPETPELSLRDLLSDEVADQFDSLDEGLDDLESLVVSIESALSSINGNAEEAVTEEEAEAVSEAA